MYILNVKINTVPVLKIESDNPDVIVEVLAVPNGEGLISIRGDNARFYYNTDIIPESYENNHSN